MKPEEFLRPASLLASHLTSSLLARGPMGSLNVAVAAFCRDDPNVPQGCVRLLALGGRSGRSQAGGLNFKLPVAPLRARASMPVAGGDDGSERERYSGLGGADGQYRYAGPETSMCADVT